MKKDLSNKVLFGVCSGLGKQFKVDPSLLRIAFLIGAIFLGFPLLIYLILAVVMPDA